MEINHTDIADIRCAKCRQWLSETITNPMPTHPSELGRAMARAGWLNHQGDIYCWGCANVYIK